MSGDDRELRSYWEDLSRLDPDAAIIDPNDRRGSKNRYLAGIRDAAFRDGLQRYAIGSGVLLDLGCGTGSSTRPLLDAGHAVIGIDISRGLLRHARERCGDEDCVFVATDGKHLPIADGALDAVTVYVVLSYLIEDDRVRDLLEAVRRALKPGAPLLMIEQVRARRRVTRDGPKVQRTLSQWQALLSSAGFTVELTRALRHGRFPTTPLIAAGLVPRALWSFIAGLETSVAATIGILPWDYAEVLFEARA